MFGKLLAQRKLRQQTGRNSLDLYQQLVTHARSQYFYLAPLNIEDTVEGRFELILIHLFLVDYWLSTDDRHVVLRRTLQETLITDMDRSLREMGIGDMSVGKQMKQVGSALLGRLQSYKAAFDQARDDTETKSKLTEILTRNIIGYEKADAATPLADYMVAQWAALSAIDVVVWKFGDVLFSDPAN